MKIPLFRPPVGDEEVRALSKTLKSFWLGLGPKTAEFEKKFAGYIGSPHAIGTNSCTASLHLALKALGASSGEVLIPNITFVSTPHAALYNNLTPVFVDVEPDTLCMDVADLERKINSRTRAIVPVHMGGHPCDMDPILKIARSKSIPVIEDCANSCGTEYKGKKVGSLGDIGCFSFEAKKNMTTGDGGMITLADGKKAETLKRWRWVGIDRDTWKRFSSEKTYSWYYEVSELGYKYNMNDIQATLGLVQLKKLDRLNEKKRKIIRNYKGALKDIPWLTLPAERPWAKGYYWLFIVQVEDRDGFIEYMSSCNITTGVHFMPMSLHPLYKNSAAVTPIADKVWKKIVTLPLYSDMTSKEFGYIVDAVKKFSPRSKAL